MLFEVMWTPPGVDASKTKTGMHMPPEMKQTVDLLRKELKDNGITLGKISSASRDAYNQGRVMYANWFDLPKNKFKQGESQSDLLSRRRRYLVKLYSDRKAKAVDDILSSAYIKNNDGKGGISPNELKVALNKVEAYLIKNPISNHQGNSAIDIAPNPAVKDFINSKKSKYAISCLDEGNHLHIKLNIGAKNKKKTNKSTDVNIESKKQTTPSQEIDNVNIDNVKPKIVIKPVTKDKFLKLRKFFGDRIIKISPTNTSNDENTIKKIAVVERNNTVYSLNSLINEKFGDNIKRKTQELIKGNTGTNTDTDTNSQIPTKDVLKGNVDSTVDVNNIQQKPQFDLIYDKALNLIQIKALNKEATNYIGYGLKNINDPTEAHEIAILLGIDNFKTMTELNTKEDTRIQNLKKSDRTKTPKRRSNAELIVYHYNKIKDPEIKNVKSKADTSSILDKSIKNTDVHIPSLDEMPAEDKTEDLNKRSSARPVIRKGALIGNLLKKDLNLKTTEEAAAIVGNLIAESALYPDRIQGKGIKRGTLPEAGSGGYSYAQWTHSSWKEKLRKFAKTKNFNIEERPLNDDMAYGFLLHTLKDHKSIKLMRKVNTDLNVMNNQFEGPIGIYTDIFLKKYEKPANQGRDAWKKRTIFAIEVANEMDRLNDIDSFAYSRSHRDKTNVYSGTIKRASDHDLNNA